MAFTDDEFTAGSDDRHSVEIEIGQGLLGEWQLIGLPELPGDDYSEKKGNISSGKLISLSSASQIAACVPRAHRS